jgi:hypothetical protein
MIIYIILPLKQENVNNNKEKIFSKDQEGRK